MIFLCVFLPSCVVGPALDQIHVVGGALSYADPWLLEQAWWVGPQFGLAFAGLAMFALEMQLRFGDPAAEPTPTPRVLLQVGLFLAAYLVTGALHERPWVVTGVLAAALVVRLVAVRPDAASVLTMALLAVAGTLYEGTLSSVPGTFDYTTVVLGLPVPIWLPLLYAHGAPLLRSFMVNTARARGVEPTTG